MKLNFLKTITLSIGLFLFQSPVQAQNNTNEEPFQVILMIGDGMGVAQLSSAFYFGSSNPNFAQFPIVGLSETSAVSHLITDSASGATAMATGQKTYKRAIGMNKDSVSIPTLLEQVQTAGFKTGLVSVSSITDATPASFYAHVKDRDQNEDIALTLSTKGVDFIAGGGRDYFNMRKDKKNLLDVFKTANYHVETRKLTAPDLKRKNVYLLDKGGLPNRDQGRDNYLPEVTGHALEYLSAQKAPFFIMIEGSYIDWGGHAKMANRVIEETLDFDRAIGVAIGYVKKHPNTLLIVTADHETGGISLGKHYEKDPKTGKRNEVPLSVQVDFNSDQHTATLVPVLAMGKHAELFSGVYANSSIYHKIVQALAKEGIQLEKK